MISCNCAGASPHAFHFYKGGGNFSDFLFASLDGLGNKALSLCGMTPIGKGRQHKNDRVTAFGSVPMYLDTDPSNSFTIMILF